MVLQRGGAAAISIVTEPDHFLGELEWIDAVRRARRVAHPDEGLHRRLVADPGCRGARRRRRAADRGAAVRDRDAAPASPRRGCSGSTASSRCTTLPELDVVDSRRRDARSASTTATCARSRSISRPRSSCCRKCRRLSTAVAESGLSRPDRSGPAACDALRRGADGRGVHDQRRSGGHAARTLRRRAGVNLSAPNVRRSCRWRPARDTRTNAGQGVRPHAISRTLEAAFEAGADWLGFVVHGRARVMSIRRARAEIIAALPGVTAVAVMVAVTPEDALAIARRMGAAARPAASRRLRELAGAISRCPSAIVVPVDAGGYARRAPFRSRAHLVMLDTAARQRAGGTGETFPWDAAHARRAHPPVMMAGGLGRRATSARRSRACSRSAWTRRRGSNRAPGHQGSRTACGGSSRPRVQAIAYGMPREHDDRPERRPGTSARTAGASFPRR